MGLLLTLLETAKRKKEIGEYNKVWTKYKIGHSVVHPTTAGDPNKLTKILPPQPK